MRGKPPCTSELWSAITTRIWTSSHSRPFLHAATQHQGGSYSSEALQSSAPSTSPSEACSTPSSTAQQSALTEYSQHAVHDTPAPSTSSPSTAAPQTTLASLLHHGLHQSSNSGSNTSSSSLPASHSMQGLAGRLFAAHSSTSISAARLSSAFPLHASTCAASAHGFATITKTGVPKPRPEVEEVLSTHHGGHLARTISLTESLPELAQVVEEHKGKLEPVHINLAARKLYSFVVIDKRAPGAALHVQLIAHALEQAACKQAMWMTAYHVGRLVSDLTGVNYKLQNETLTLMAATLTMEDCQRLRSEDGHAWRDVAYGFAMQGFANQVFWDTLSLHAIEYLPTWWAQHAASFLKHVTVMADRPREEFVRVAAEELEKKAISIPKRDLVDALYALVKLVDIPEHHRQSQLRLERELRQGRLGPGPVGPSSSTKSTKIIDTSSSSNGSGSSSSSSSSQKEGPSNEQGALQTVPNSSNSVTSTAPAPYSPELVSMLRERLVCKLRDAALRGSGVGSWNHKSLPLFASSLVTLNAWDHRTRSAIVAIISRSEWLEKPDIIQPYYIVKLARAAMKMGCANEDFYQTLMKHALRSVHRASAQLQMNVIQTFQSIPAAASQDIAQELAEKVSGLNRNTRIRVSQGKSWIVGEE